MGLLLIAATSGAIAEEEAHQLQLETYINGTSTRLIGSFVQLPDRRLAAKRGELAELGIKAPGTADDSEWVVVNDLPGVAYRYDEPTQSIFFTLGDAQRVRQTYDMRSGSAATPPVPSDFGGLVNYALFAGTTKSFDTGVTSFSGANASLDSRVFGPFGTFSQSAIVGSTTSRSLDFLRLESAYTYTDPEDLRVYRGGDTISGGLAWTRPIRIGGMQLQRDFALRPDLVTLPLPTVSGSAAVPSTLDVYVDNLRVHSQDVPAGPYQITNIPVLSGVGTARVVIQDASGRQIETSLPFYSSAKLLREGFNDFSVEAGLPRLNFGTLSNSYATEPVGSGTLRVGLKDWLTLEGHAEGGARLGNGGIGSVTRLASFGILSLAASGSESSQGVGGEGYAAFDTQFFEIDFHASALQTSPKFNDLASVTARQSATFNVVASALTVSTAPPRSLDTVSVSLPLPLDASRVNFGLVYQALADGTRSNLVSVSYSRPLFGQASFYATAFTDLHEKKSAGLFVGLSMPLWTPSPTSPPLLGSTNVSSVHGGATVTSEVDKPLLPEPNSYGWRVRDSEGASPYREVAGTYRASIGQFDGLVQQSGNTAAASLQAQGAIAVMGGGVFFANPIDDAFAVVNAGAPGIGVLYENRPVGNTNGDGQLLIPNLRSYQPNKVAIEPVDLPLDAEAATTKAVVAPYDRAGIIVNFGVVPDVKAAVVVLTGKDGNFVSPGSRGRLVGGTEDFFVGYDGRAFIKELGAANTVAVEVEGGACHASFAFAPQKNTQVVIGPVTCQ
jgi:outer membrane usher protein